MGGPLAELSSSPRTLIELWMEYICGTGGRKPAKHFTPQERGGKNKFRYCRRKVFWDCVAKHVNAGYEAQSAITKIHECYGHNQSVTNILVAMAKEKKMGDILIYAFSFFYLFIFNTIDTVVDC